jgi:hypothetical protein
MSNHHRGPEGGFVDFWTTLPGMLTAIAALITAVVGIATVVRDDGSVPHDKGAAGSTAITVTSHFETIPSTSTALSTTVTDSGTATGLDVGDAEFTVTLVIPLAGDGDTTSEISLSEGKVTTSQSDIEYARDDSTNRPRLESRHDTVSLLPPGEPISKATCEEAVDRRPVNPTIRQLTQGTSICLRDDDEGIGVIRILKPPNRTGALTVSVSYWPLG